MALFAIRLTPIFFQTKNKAIPIKANKIVQTGPKIQLGGLKDGLTIVLYQVAIDGEVKIEPITPAASQITILKISFKTLDILNKLK